MSNFKPCSHLFLFLDAIARGSVCAGVWTPQRARLLGPVNCSNKACAREMSLAGLLMREPNEYEWSLHTCSFVSLNSFTPHWSWKGYSELNVNHIFTGTKQISVSFFKKHNLIMVQSSPSKAWVMDSRRPLARGFGGRWYRSHMMGNLHRFLSKTVDFSS